MKKMKALISILLVLSMTAGLFVPGFAETEANEEPSQTVEESGGIETVSAIIRTFGSMLGAGTPTQVEAEEAQGDETETENETENETEIQSLTQEPAVLLNAGPEADEAQTDETAEPAEGENSGAAEGETPAQETPAEPAEDNSKPGRIPGSFSFNKSVFYDQFTVSGRVPIMATVSILKSLRYAVYFLSGHFLYGTPKTFDVSVSEDVIELCDYMKEHSSLDLYKILTNLPDVSEPAELAGKVLNIDPVEFRAEMYEKRDEFAEQGDETKANLCWLVGAYMSGIKKAEIYTIPYKDIHEIELKVTYSDGSEEIFHPNIKINFETGECTGRSEKGMMSAGFNSNVYDLFVYAPMYCWMRDFGFCVEYDILCYLLPMYRYRTRRFKFSYGDKDWMIQCWKGNYMCTNGGEVGIYNREKGKYGSYYDVITDEELMPMSLTVSHGDDVIVNVEETPHWWVNGFKLASELYHPMSLKEVFSITFYDEEIRDAFCEAVDKNIYHDVTYTVDGLKVTCTWYN